MPQIEQSRTTLPTRSSARCCPAIRVRGSSDAGFESLLRPEFRNIPPPRPGIELAGRADEGHSPHLDPGRSSLRFRSPVCARACACGRVPFLAGRSASPTKILLSLRMDEGSGPDSAGMEARHEDRSSRPPRPEARPGRRRVARDRPQLRPRFSRQARHRQRSRCASPDRPRQQRRRALSPIRAATIGRSAVRARTPSPGAGGRAA